MKTIDISTQEELDALPMSFDEFTIIKIRNSVRTLVIKYSYGNASAELYGNASAELYGNASAELYGNASAELYDNASARLYGNASARLYGNASARLYDNASAELYGNASARLYDNASAELYDNASAELYGNASAKSFSHSVVIDKLLDNAVLQCIDINTISINTQDSTATVIYSKTPPMSLDRIRKIYSDQCTDEGIYLYKVTDWNHMDHYTGSIYYSGTVVCPDFDPNPDRECGGGLHLSPRPHMARKYNQDGPMHKCFVRFEHIVVHARSDDKVRCSQVDVVGLCDENGNLIKSEAAA